MAKLKGFEKLTYTYEALQMWFNALEIKPCREVTIPLNEAFNRVTAEDVMAEEDLPRFDRSAVDGYAVRSEDTSDASQFKPLLFRLTEEDELPNTGHRYAKQVWTGQPIPKGANAVAMLENTNLKEKKIEIAVQLAPTDNVSRKSEDLRKGETAIPKGTRLKPYHVALLAALGKAEVKVIEKPKIAIVATGNELAETTEQRQPSQIYDSNRIMLCAMCQELDAEPLDIGIAKDDIDEIVEKLEIALKIGDAVLTTGGTSVGGLDLVPEAVNKLGKPGVIVHGIAMRPGMPTALAALEQKPVLVLSGNPVAAIIGFEVFGRPLIGKMLGLTNPESRCTVEAKMTRKIATALGRKNFVRVKVTKENEDAQAEPVSAKGSGALSTMTKANGYVVVPENREGLGEGETVTVHLFTSLDAEGSDV